MPRSTNVGRAPAPTPPAPAPPEHPSAQALADLACEVATVLGRMTFAERVWAYRAGVFTHRELSIAAGRLPNEMPLPNGEYEWIAISAE